MSKRGKLYSILIALIFLLTIVIFQIVILFKMENIANNEQAILNIKADLNDLNNRTHLVVDDIDDSLEQFKEEQAWIQESNYTIKEVNTDEETIRVMFDWSLRELANDESVSFLYRDKSNSDWFESEVKNSGGLNYYIEKTLPLIANYEMQVIAKSKTGKRTATLNRLNMKDLIDNRFEMNANFFESREGIYEVDVNVYNTYYDYDDFSFGTMKL